MAVPQQRDHGKGFLRQVWLFRKSILLVACPFLLSPLLLINPTTESKCAFGVLLVSVYWTTTVFPPFVTALLPGAIFPLVGLQKSKEVSNLYFADVVFLTLGAGLTSIIIQSRALHRRMALRVLSRTPPTPLCLSLSLWGCSAMLSTVIPNSTVVTMLSPIAFNICNQLDENIDNGEQEGLQPMAQPDPSDVDIEVVSLNKVPTERLVKNETFRKGLLLGVIYSSRVGSLAMLTGALIGLILKGHVDLVFGEDSRVNVLSWFLFACPMSLLTLVLVWTWLYIRYTRHNSFTTDGANNNRKTGLRRVIQEEHSKLAPIKPADCFVLGYSFLLVVLWFSRGLWESVSQVTDSFPAILVAILLFSTPGLKPSYSKTDVRDQVSRYARVDWLSVQKLFPWTSLFMIGGGLALASIYQTAGLAEVVSSAISGSITLPTLVTGILLAAVISLLAEIVSGTVLSNLMLPLISDWAMTGGSNSLYFMLIVSVSSSMGFILPVSRFLQDLVPESSLRISTKELIISGLVVKAIYLLMLILAVNTWAVHVMVLDTPTNWTVTFRHGPHVNTPLVLCNDSFLKTVV